MIVLTIAELVAAMDGRWCAGPDSPAGIDDPAETSVTGEIRIDSRACSPGDVFFALPGEHADGLDYAGAAHQAGAVAVVAIRAIPDVPSIVVADPMLALGKLASAVLDRSPGLTVIGITGSSGKTSTKDLIGELLERWEPTVCALGSYNNDLGVPLTVLGVDRQTRFLVLEMGSRGIGHITRLTDIARPAIGLIVNIGTAHLGEFGSAEAVARAKSELVAALPPAAQGGVAVLNADDLATPYLRGRTTAAVWTFGAGPDADVRYSDVDVSAGGRPRFRLSAGGQHIDVSLQLVGAHQASNAAAASAVVLAALAAGQPPASPAGAATAQAMADLGNGLGAARPRSPWRMELTDRADGVSILNDAYNANPESMLAALDALVAIAGDTRRSWAVLGGMGELGDHAESEHESVGRAVRERGVHRLVAVGPDAGGIYAGAAVGTAEEEGFIQVPDMNAALHVLRRDLRPGDVILIKASRYVGLERLADELIEGAAPA